MIVFLGLALALAGCGRKADAARQPPEFPWPATARQDFIMGATGLEPFTRGATVGEAATNGLGLVSPLAPRAAALSTPASGTYVLAALNRFGLGFVEPSPDGSAYKVRSVQVPAMGGQGVVGLWPRGGRGEGFLLELGRDPFSQGIPPRSDFSPELLLVNREGSSTILPRLGEEGEDLFALLPGPADRWYAEFRTEAPLGAKLRYASLASPDDASSAEELRRDLFEAALAPRALSAAPAALRDAVAAMALPEGMGILIHSHDAAGDEAYWITTGLAEDAVEAYAWLSASGADAVVALRSGIAACKLAGPAGNVAPRRFQIAPARPGAELAGITALFPGPREAKSVPALAVASWECGIFPCVSAAGISVVPLP